MILSKKILAFLLVVLLLQPLVLLGIFRLNDESASIVVTAILQNNKVSDMYQSSRVMKEGTDIILKQYEVKDYAELIQLSDRIRLETKSLNEKFASESKLRLHAMVILVALEFLLCLAGITCLLMIFGKSRKNIQTHTELPNALA
jgi:hypothetical protein